MAKKRARSKSHPLKPHENNMKAVLALLILVIAFGVYLIFNNYSDSLLSSPSLLFFLFLVIVLFALLTGLLFLVNPQKHGR